MVGGGGAIEGIRIIGTGHVLEKSVREVEEVIEREKPDIVAVELCESRYKALKGEIEALSPKELLSARNPFLLLMHWLLAYVQRKMGRELGVEPGADMMAAIRKAEELGCQVALIDRPIHITMQRFWKKMRFTEKLKMIFSILFSIARMGTMGGEEKGTGRTDVIELDRITDDDVVTQLMHELRAFSPGAATALLDERDAYIARSLLDLHTQPSVSSPGGARKIVAVVGAGHVAGIKRYLSHPELIPPREELCALPRKRFGLSLTNLLGIGLGVAFLLILFAITLTDISFQLILRAIFWWFMINGLLSAVGVLLARGHLLSACTAFAVAWLTSLNPFLAAGWFAGLVEARLRQPSLEDAKNMLNVDSLRELMSNRLFKVILVAALANLGSTAGTFIGLYVVGHVLGVDIYAIWTGLKSFLVGLL